LINLCQAAGCTWPVWVWRCISARVWIGKR